MDVITISSDSEASLNDADVTLINCTQREVVDWDCDNYGWNYDDDDRPPINYYVESPKNEDAQQINPEEEIENYITPMKNTQNNVLLGKEDEDTVPYELPPKADNLLSSDSETISSQSSNPTNRKRTQRQKLSQEERVKKKLEQQKQKALKAAFFENQRNIKPEENIKFLKVHIDNEIINSGFGGTVLSLLQENNIQYAVETQRKHFTVTWSKKKIEKVINDRGELTENLVVTDENIMLYVLDWEKAVNLIHNNDLLSHIEIVKSAFCDKKITLIIIGLEKYFKYQKKKRSLMISEKKKSKPKPSERVFEEAPSISKDQLEYALTDLQLIGKYNCRLLETSEEFSSLILNFTKSLSQIEFKLEKQKRQTDTGWISADSHPAVKVDKLGNGLLQLWQQQICQFSTVGLETAQAIVSQYNSPLALVNEYEKIETTKERELLLQNIQIRREAGLLSTSRRVGPQLSKKLCRFFTTDDPNVEV